MAENGNKSDGISPPPPNLPRRGGTDTIGYLIIICKHLIICDLSANRVTCISPSGENERGLMAIG